MAPIPYWECMVFTMWGRYCSQQIDIERAITVSNNGHSFQLIMYNLRELFHRFGSILGACFAGLPIPIASSSINCIRPECEAHGNESGSFPIEIELLVAHKSHIFFFVWLKSRKNEVVALPWMCIECAVFQVQTLVNSRIAFYLWTCTVYIAARQRMHTSLCSDGGWRCSIVPLRGACKRNGNTHKLLRTKKLKFFSYYYSDRSGCSCAFSIYYIVAGFGTLLSPEITMRWDLYACRMQVHAFVVCWLLFGGSCLVCKRKRAVRSLFYNNNSY